MSNLKEIADSIINKNFDKALKLCEIYQNEKNKYIILNFKGAIYLSQNNFEDAEFNFSNATSFLKILIVSHFIRESMDSI